MVKDLHQVLNPTENAFQIEIRKVFACIDKLSEQQKYYQRTRGSHAALILDRRLEMIAFAEDVGRHNALDKAIGKAFVARKLQQAVIAVMSSRISYELVQKAARAHLPVLISMSRPTALSIEMGKALNLTLACADKGSELIVLCGEHRIVF
jgi:FdhD protein